jgi:hypothetical protein
VWDNLCGEVEHLLWYEKNGCSWPEASVDRQGCQEYALEILEVSSQRILYITGSNEVVCVAVETGLGEVEALSVGQSQASFAFDTTHSVEPYSVSHVRTVCDLDQSSLGLEAKV